MEQMFNYQTYFSDASYIAAASALAPAIIRIGGISCDFITYSVPGHPHPAPTPAPSTWSWQGAAQNFSTAQFESVLGFLNASGLRLLWDLNELVGRECTNAYPGGGGDTWCLGEWASGNARDFLQWVHDEGLYGPGSTLAGISAGNELRGHLDPAANTADILELAGILEVGQGRGTGRGYAYRNPSGTLRRAQDIWGPTGAPPLYATDTGVSQGREEGALSKPPPFHPHPSTDDCYDNETRAIMTNLSASGASLPSPSTPIRAALGPRRTPRCRSSRSTRRGCAAAS